MTRCTAGLFPSYSGAEIFLAGVEISKHYQKQLPVLVLEIGYVDRDGCDG